MVKIAVLVSGGGTNLQALIDREQQGELGSGKICLVLSSRPDVYALERAKNAGIESIVVDRKQCSSPEQFSAKVLEQLQSRGIEMVVLAGFLSILCKDVVQAYPNRIINVHPSLIPSFCGKGFYGLSASGSAGLRRQGHRRYGALCQRGDRWRQHPAAKGGLHPAGRHTRNAAKKGDGAGRMGTAPKSDRDGL